MIKIQPIRTSDLSCYTFMEQLMVDAFPVEEYRLLEELRQYTDAPNNFYNNLIFDDALPVGFITYWEFEKFYYIEHFAIHPQYRNFGYGQQTLQHLRRLLPLPIVLEVERPTDELSQRRIRFYQRQGFVLWEKDYHQPSYKPGAGTLPMYLMTHGNLHPEKDYEAIKDRLYKVVYNKQD